MARLEIIVKRDTCLGYDVFRGSIEARSLAPAMWIDFYDQDVNPYGYQRPFNTRRRQEAAEYAANEPNAFWPESIVAIRENSEVDNAEDRVKYEFIGLEGSESDFGKLVVEFNDARTEYIGSEHVNWRRAFSQVDCQHRLGYLANSDRHVTICIIPGISRLEEARIFKTINDTQKKISTSLVDVIVMLLSENELEQPDIHWAFNLGIDVGSSFYKLVDAEGRNVVGQSYAVTLRTLRTCASSLVGGKRYIREQVTSNTEYDQIYLFLRNYWNVVRGLWPSEFSDRRRYKLMTVPGLKGLSRFGRPVFWHAMEDGDISERRIRTFFRGRPALIDWSVNGPFRDATGNAGARVVYEALIDAYGVP